MFLTPVGAGSVLSDTIGVIDMIESVQGNWFLTRREQVFQKSPEQEHKVSFTSS